MYLCTHFMPIPMYTLHAHTYVHTSCPYLCTHFPMAMTHVMHASCMSMRLNISASCHAQAHERVMWSVELLEINFMCVCMCVCVYLCMWVCVYVCMCVCVSVCMYCWNSIACACVCVYLCMCVCVCVCMFYLCMYCWKSIARACVCAYMCMCVCTVGNQSHVTTCCIWMNQSRTREYTGCILMRYLMHQWDMWCINVFRGGKTWKDLWIDWYGYTIWYANISTTNHLYMCWYVGRHHLVCIFAYIQSSINAFTWVDYLVGG